MTFRYWLRTLQRLAAGSGRAAARLHPQALEALKSYRFPGNVRELENVLERAHTLCENQLIEAADLRLSEGNCAVEGGIADLTRIDNLEDYLENVERKLILQALEETRWNRTAAAQRLSLSFRSMRYRLKKLGLD
jgi:two-component system response regulator PilR (NtrC family)